MALTDKLINIADAIRAKTGDTALLTLDEMPNEITNIVVGNNDMDKYIQGTLSTITSTATLIKTNCFRSQTGIYVVNFPEATIIQGSAFWECTELTQGSFPKVEAIAASAFYGCTGFGRLNFPLVTAIDSAAFYGCFNLNIVVIGTSSCTLSDSYSTFEQTGISYGMGGIYVPDTAVNTYKNATNWSAYGDYIKPISELPQ